MISGIVLDSKINTTKTKYFRGRMKPAVLWKTFSLCKCYKLLNY